LIVMCVMFARGCPGTAPPANQPPIADAGADQVVDAGASVTLDGSGSSDPDGDSLSFSWKKISGAAVSVGNTSAASLTFTAPDVGTTLVFELTVGDGQSSSVATVNVSVRPVESSVQLVEMMQRSVTEDPAAMGNFPNDWLVDVGNDLPQVTSGDDDNELAEFGERFEQSRAPRIVQEALAPGATRTVSLEIAGASGLSGLAQWIGTTNPLNVTIGLDGSTLVTGTTYEMGTDRGGSYLQAAAPAGGLATMSVTNTSEVTVQVRIVFVVGQ
jgi:hypothetical protein